MIPTTTIHADTLQDWRVTDDSANGYYSIMDKSGNTLFVVPDKRTAAMVASVPALLRFMESITRRTGSPIKIDAERILANCGISLEH